MVRERGNNGSSQEKDELRMSHERYSVVRLREFDPQNEADLNIYFRLLTDPLNISHFSSPPKDPEDLKQKLERDKTHAYLAENINGEVIGAGGINDASEGEHDHFLVKVVVDPELQGRGVGRILVIQLIEKAFSTKTTDGRERTKLDAAIIRNVPGWDRMPHILEQLGFQPKQILLRQVDVLDQEKEEVVRKSTERWEIMKEEWMRIRRRVGIAQG